MPGSLCLTRQCLGMTTRIECITRPLSGGQGLWTLLCAAGLSGKQPTVIKAQGPFRGPKAAEAVLVAIAENLCGQGYVESDALLTWQLHLHGELRKIDGPRALQADDRLFHPKG